MRTYLSIIVCVFAFSTGCVSYNVPKPAGFAEYAVKNGVYRAITAEGVRLRVYRIRNKPYGEAAMWNDSAALYLKSRGYREKKRTPVTSKNGMKGTHTEYLYRYYGKDYIYSLVFFADKKFLYIIEAGGTDREYGRKRSSMLAAIRGFSVK